VDSHPLDITHALVQDSPLGNYLLCEQHKVQHTTSIVSSSTYAVTYACIKLSEGVLNSDGTGPEIEFLKWTWLIGRICSLRAFSISAGILIASLPFSIPELVMTATALQLCFKTPVGPFVRICTSTAFKILVGTNRRSVAWAYEL